MAFMDYQAPPTNGDFNVPQLPSGYGSAMFSNLTAQQKQGQIGNVAAAGSAMPRSNTSGGAALAGVMQAQNRAGQQNQGNAAQVGIGAADNANQQLLKSNDLTFKSGQDKLNAALQQRRIALGLQLQKQQQDFDAGQAMMDRAYNVAGSDLGAVTGRGML